MSDTPNESRAADARLHTALYGVTCERRGCEPDSVEMDAKWVEVQSSLENRTDLPKHHSLDDYTQHPCYKDVRGRWQVVPFYSTDVAAAHEAEGALPEAVRERYAEELWLDIGDEDAFYYVGSGNGHATTNWVAHFFYRRATPAQMVAAMLMALEGK